MNREYANHMLGKYVLSICESVGHNSSYANMIINWLGEYGYLFDIHIGDNPDDSFKKSFSPRKGKIYRLEYIKVEYKVWSKALSMLRNNLKRASKIIKSRQANNIDLICDYLGLDSIDQRIIHILYLFKENKIFHDFCDGMFDSGMEKEELLCLLSNSTMRQVISRYSPTGKLLEIGVLDYANRRGRVNYEDFDFVFSSRVYKAIRTSVSDIGSILSMILGEPTRAALRWNDFSHLKYERDFVKKILLGAISNREQGVNILLYGPPGTGKTEFCKTLARHMGVSLYSVGEDDGMGDMMESFLRLRQLRTSQALLSKGKPALLMFDEMDDILSPFSNLASIIDTDSIGGKSSSKIFINRLLENNKVPVIWITNSLRGFDKATLRRMTYALEVNPPPRKTREKVWRRVLQKENIQLPEQTIVELVNQKDVVPSVAASAAKCVRLAEGNMDDAMSVVNSLCKVMRNGPNTLPVKELETSICLDLIQSDIPSKDFSEKLITSKNKNFSLCLYGPPGTGKTEYVRFLAKEMGMEVMQQRASDLLSPYVGMAEKNIAKAFQEARDNEAFLIIDEADSFLQNREHAVRSWEVTQVNEMLTWMEVHPLPFACTTNMMSTLDSASLRRFTFKIGFSYLSNEQVYIAFQYFFQQEWPKDIQIPDALTPGDFAVVKRKINILGEKSKYQIIEWLKDESRQKTGIKNEIGFHATP